MKFTKEQLQYLLGCSNYYYDKEEKDKDPEFRTPEHLSSNLKLIRYIDALTVLETT